MHLFRRRHASMLRSGLVLITALLAFMSTASAADKLSIRLEWTAWAMHMPLHLAVERGWFKAADLDVEIEDGNGTITMIQLVGNGKFDLGHGAVSAAAIAAAKGLPIISLSSYLRKSPLGIIYAKNAGIERIGDLKGKRVIFTPASFESPLLEPFLAQNGLPMGSVELIGIDPASKISSYISGVGAAFVTTVPGDMPHVEDRRPSGSFLFADNGMNLPTFGIVANTAALKTKGDAIKRFVSVVSASWAYILEGHEKEAADAVMKQRPNAPTSVPTLVAEFQAHRPFFGTDGRSRFPGVQDAADWTSAIKEMEDAKLIPPGSKPEKFFTNDFIDQSYGTKIVAGTN